MPFRKQDYPANWATEIVPAILARAGEERDEMGNITREARCEWCYVPNHTIIHRMPDAGSWRRVQYAPGAWKLVPEYDWYIAPAYAKGTRIVLTTAHLDRNRENNAMDNLASLCQRCHLNHDREAQHIYNRRYGRYASRQPKLFDDAR